MDHSPSPDAHSDRIARAAARLNVASARVSQARELVTIAKDRLSRARLALAETQTEEELDPAAHGNALNPDTLRSSDARGKEPS